jgi:hypothetical protein
MPDDITKRENGDGFQLSPEDSYEAQYLARKLGLTAAEARDMIKHFGSNRDALERHKNLA